MIDETFCWTLYQASSWSNYGRPMRFAITILPIVVYLIVGLRAFKTYESKTTKAGYWIGWRDLRWAVLLLIPWAVSQILGIAYYTLCYSP